MSVVNGENCSTSNTDCHPKSIPAVLPIARNEHNQECINNDDPKPKHNSTNTPRETVHVNSFEYN